jgi:type VI secretion system protein ImpL
MKFSLQDPAFLTLLLAAVVLFAVVLIAVAVFLVLKSRKKGDEKKPEESHPGILRRWFPATAPGMAESFREAMRRLRERLPEWGYRYKVPWYLLVGESGSGKTSIANALSGMSADIVEPRLGEYAPRWLLLKEAVLIDLPGRAFLSTEPAPAAPGSPLPSFLDDGNASPGRSSSQDRNALSSFLRLTAHYRPRQPLNGLVLTIPATELLETSIDPEHPHRLAHIADLAQRLDAIQHLTGLSVPIYVLVTKCDAITGFVSYSRSFFRGSTLNRTGNNGHVSDETFDNLFGWSNPHLLDSAFSPTWVDEAFDDTNEVLLRRQMEMLAESKTVADADEVFLFPFELARLRVPLRILLNGVFRTTAYHSPHLLRGIYFCGMEPAAGSGSPGATASPADLIASDTFRPPAPRILFVRHLFEFKVFAERYLSTPVAARRFSGNRSVLVAQIAACAIILLLGIGSIRAWHRLSRLQASRINPVLQSLAASLDAIAVSPVASVSPAVDLFNSLGAIRESQYYSPAFPASYLDLGGVHRNLRDTLERTFEIVVLRSCKYALENRISALLDSPPEIVPSVGRVSSYPPGTAWTIDPAYLALHRYLAELQTLQTNIARYRLINSSGSGSFKQLNDLMRYLGARDLPDTSRLAQDPAYQKLLLDATWQPLQVPLSYHQLTAAALRQRITNFYRSWFDSNPLIGEVQTLAGEGGLQALSSPGATVSNQQLRAIVSRTRAIDNQLTDGGYDWVAQSFSRQSYPALGPELDQMPFADNQFIDGVVAQGTQKLADMRVGLRTTPEVLDIENGRTRLNGQVRTLASVLDALLGYELMADAYDGSAESGTCRLIPAGTVWDQNDLSKALELDAMRGRIESELLPGLPGEYRDMVRRLVDRRAAVALLSVLQAAAVQNPNQGDKQAALQTELQNLNQSVDKLKQIGESLAGLHATAEVSCLDKSVARQAGSLLSRINQQLPALYDPTAATVQPGNGLPASLWLYGVGSADDLQTYLAAERQQIESLSAQAAPLVQLLRTKGGHSDVLPKWRNISQDVAALQSKKPGNPIETLETFISTDLDKITPEANCKGSGIHSSSDVFLRVRADLSSIAVNRCYSVAVSRFNEIASDFNQHLAGHFPFTQLLDTRPGSEADPARIAGFYQIVDRDSPGLEAVLSATAQTPADLVAFLQAVATVRPLVLGSAKNPNPALGLSVLFRTNRDREVFGNRIAQWTMLIGQQTLSFPPNPGDIPPLTWQFGDPVTLTLRYANNSPEAPSSQNPSPVGRAQGMTVSYQYQDAWSLFALFKDHPPAPGLLQNQYTLKIPNTFVTSPGSAAPPPETLVYVQIDVLPVGAKAGGATLPVPAFPYKAPAATLKTTSGD